MLSSVSPAKIVTYSHTKSGKIIEKWLSSFFFSSQKKGVILQISIIEYQSKIQNIVEEHF